MNTAVAFRAALFCVCAFAVHAIPPNQQVGADRFHFHVASHSDEMDVTAAEVAQAAARGTHVVHPAATADATPVNNPGPGEAAAETARHSWPELVGGSWEHAQAVLTVAGKKAQMVPQGSAVTMDFREDRVRVFVDREQVVVAVPHIG